MDTGISAEEREGPGNQGLSGFTSATNLIHQGGQGQAGGLAAGTHRPTSEGYEHPFFWAPFILVGER